ncbi:MAG: ATP-binding protein [Fusobacteriota bacterium]
MKKLSFKNIILLTIIVIYISSSGIIFYNFNSVYTKNLKENFLNENKYSRDVIYDLVLEELGDMSLKAREIGDNDILRHAMYHNQYITFDYRSKENPVGINKMNKLSYIQMTTRLKSMFFGWGEGPKAREMELFDKKGNFIAGTGPLDNRSKNKPYLDLVLTDGDNEYGTELGIIEEYKPGEFVLKGISSIHRARRMGAVVIRRNMNLQFLHSLKSTVNRELVLVKDEKILNQTFLFDDEENEHYLDYNPEDDIYILDIRDKTLGFHLFPLKDYKGDVIGQIGVGFDYGIFNEVYHENLDKFIRYSVLFLITMIFIIYINLNLIFSPVDKVLKAIQEIESGNYDYRIDLKLRKELGKIAHALNGLSWNIQKREKELKNLNQNLEQKVLDRTKELEKTTKSVKTLLDNAGQGFLSFSQDLIIQGEYSRECINIFEKNINEKKISDLIYPKDKEKQTFFESTITEVFNEKGRKRRVYMSLLPNEIKINKKDVTINYKYISSEDKKNDSIMLILTDVTEKRNLEKKINIEKNRLEMIVKSLKNHDYLVDFTRRYKAFVTDEVFAILSSNLNLKESISEIFLAIHTFKANFGQLSMVNSAKSLHDFEGKLIKIKDNFNKYNKDDITKLFVSEDPLSYIQEDLHVIEDTLGGNFLDEEPHVSIKRSKIKEIEKILEGIATFEKKDNIIKKVRRLRYSSVKKELQKYIDLVRNLSSQQGKIIDFTEIKGKNILVNPDIYQDFFKSLIHLFRNIVDHGIEKPEERLLNDKKEIGNINCYVKTTKNHIEFIIEDDGSGLDLKKIKKIALKKGIYKKSEINSVSDTELKYLIFNEDFSTKDKISEVSGRGVGMSSVKKEIEKLDGRIFVQSEEGKGTRFIIFIKKSD